VLIKTYICNLRLKVILIILPKTIKNKMKEKFISPRVIFIASIVFFGALMRLIPHWPNFTPVAAIALFGGTYFSRKYMAFLVPLSAMFISDLIIGLHNNMIAVYLAFSATVLIGFLLSRKVNSINVILAALSSSVLFFIVTNFASWLTMGLYPMNFVGLMESYLAGLVFFNDGSMGISFFLNSVTSTLLYSGLFFSIYYLAQLRFPVLAGIKNS
jgi:hypothetical protein